MDKIKYLRYGDGNVNKLTKGEMLHCNNLWKEYSPSRLNDWDSYIDNYTTPSRRDNG